jgi:hypothetical protein
MILLDYIPHMILSVFAGGLCAIFLKLLSEHKNLFKAFKLTLLGVRVLFTFPFFLYKIGRKKKSELIHHINKDKEINATTKKKLRKIISSDFLLFFFLFRMQAKLFKDLFSFYVEYSRKFLEDEIKTGSIMDKEATYNVKKGLYKSIEYKLGKSFT